MMELVLPLIEKWVGFGGGLAAFLGAAAGVLLVGYALGKAIGGRVLAIPRRHGGQRRGARQREVARRTSPTIASLAPARSRSISTGSIASPRYRTLL